MPRTYNQIAIYTFPSRGIHLVLLEHIFTPFHSLQRLPSVLRQVRLAYGRDDASEEAWLPVDALLLAFRSFLSLSVLNLLLECRGVGVLLVLNGRGYIFPEAARLVRELLI